MPTLMLFGSAGWLAHSVLLRVLSVFVGSRRFLLVVEFFQLAAFSFSSRIAWGNLVGDALRSLLLAFQLDFPQVNAVCCGQCLLFVLPSFPFPFVCPCVQVAGVAANRSGASNPSRVEFIANNISIMVGCLRRSRC